MHDPFKRRAVILAGIALILIFIAWNTLALDAVLYPFRLFVTYVHEAGHALMAIATGGSVVGFVVSPNGSGLATTIGGNRAAILPAGYLGAAAFGAGLFYLANTARRTRILAGAIGVGLIVFTVLYARPDEVGRPTALLVGLGFGIILLLVAWKLAEWATLLVLDVLALLTGTHAVLDLAALVQNSSVYNGQVRNDALAFSQEILGLPAPIWAFVWAIMALLMLGAAFYFALIRGDKVAATVDALPARPKPEDESIIDILKRR